MTLRTRIAGVAGLAVAIAVLLGAALAYVAIRSELRGEVDTALRERVAPLQTRFTVGAPDPGGPGAMPGPGPGGTIGFEGGQPPVYKIFDRHAPAYGGAAGYVQFISSDGDVVRPPDEHGNLPAGNEAMSIAASGNGTRFE